ncbi:MAG: hypothetical protein IT210_01570 [Armatimonadetes bacterium]|nr:hypothetical protein [Armatimonadota bacterium]
MYPTSDPPDRLSPQSLAAVREVFSALALSIRMRSLYPAEHSLCVSSSERFVAAFRRATEEAKEIDFSVESNGFRVGDDIVFPRSADPSCPVVALYREGVRRVRIFATATPEELLLFLSLLSKEIPPDSLEDDLVILLWEADFSSITYYLATDAASESQRDKPLADGQSEIGTEDGPAGIAAADISWHSLSPEEIETESFKSLLLDYFGKGMGGASGEVVWESQLSPYEELERILRAAFVEIDDAETAGMAAGRGVDVIFSLTAEGQIEQAVRLLALLHEEFTRSDSLPLREAIGREMGRLASTAYADCLYQSIRAVPCEESSLEELLRLLPEGFLALFAPKAAALAARYSFVPIYRGLSVDHLPELYRLLQHSDSDVSAFLLTLLENTADAGILRYLGPALNADRVDVRLRALTFCRKFADTPGMEEMLFPLLSDEVFALRLQAVEQLASFRSARSMRALGEMLSGQSFEEAASDEKQSILNARAAKGQREAAPLLQGVLDQRRLFGRGRYRETQKAALMSLRNLETPLAADLLRHYADKGPRWMRAICREILSEMP